MPSTFPEAFGMVAVEAAACGVLPLSAAHSGMAEVTAALAPALSEELRPLLSFEIGPRAVEEIAAKLVQVGPMRVVRRVVMIHPYWENGVAGGGKFAR
jgi:glycosyltransferase involved in cell wall biosynthesis